MDWAGGSQCRHSSWGCVLGGGVVKTAADAETEESGTESSFLDPL